MYTRNIMIKLNPNPFSVSEFTEILENQIVPLLRRQKGFKGKISFVPPERNEALAISFWDKQHDAEAYNHVAYLDVLRVLSKVVDGMPTLETFGVANSTSHEIAASAVNSVLTEKFAKEFDGLPAVMPAKAGIQKQRFSWIPGRASYRQLARNDD